jgi:hypothetical protein
VYLFGLTEEKEIRGYRTDRSQASDRYKMVSTSGVRIVFVLFCA